MEFPALRLDLTQEVSSESELVHPPLLRICARFRFSQANAASTTLTADSVGTTRFVTPS
jgi:hypothetical protein